MILIINVCKERLHYFEFVKPIEKIIGKDFFTKHYSEVNEEDLRKADKIIICGTSLKDNQFVKDIKNFEWIKNYKKPILGICAGMQIISLVYGAKIKKETEIGFYKERFIYYFLGLSSEKEVYHLHNNYATLPKDFESFAKNKIPQAIKHKTREIYGVLFHPEIRNEKMIIEFAEL
ncbi:MAG: hypothetical protein AABX99_02335 [Nanoarchaeota archaeon]